LIEAFSSFFYDSACQEVKIHPVFGSPIFLVRFCMRINRRIPDFLNYFTLHVKHSVKVRHYNLLLTQISTFFSIESKCSLIKFDAIRTQSVSSEPRFQIFFIILFWHRWNCLTCMQVRERLIKLRTVARWPSVHRIIFGMSIISATVCLFLSVMLESLEPFGRAWNARTNSVRSSPQKAHCFMGTASDDSSF